MTDQTPTVLITGASTGIGRACAEDLAARGWQVFAGVRKQADADALHAAHQAITPVFLDVTDPAQIGAAADQITEACGPDGLSGLVNNAGVAVAMPIEFVDLDDLRWQYEVNLTGQVAVTQAVLPLLRAAAGRIVMITSAGGYSSLPFFGPYSGSKFALEATADALRVELRPWSVHVAVVEPGAIRTPIWEKSLAQTDDRVDALPDLAQQLYGPALQAAYKRAAAAGANGSPPQAVAEAVRHALTAGRPRARYMVGGDARQRRWLERLPWRLRDWLVARVMGE